VSLRLKALLHRSDTGRKLQNEALLRGKQNQNQTQLASSETMETE